MTSLGATLLEQGMDTDERRYLGWKLRIDWTVQDAYPEAAVEVWLCVWGEEPRLLRSFPSPPEAAGWCRRFIEGRGFSMFCDIDWHQRSGHTYIVIHAAPGSPSLGAGS